jgi:hypothetical protein
MSEYESVWSCSHTSLKNNFLKIYGSKKEKGSKEDNKEKVFKEEKLIASLKIKSPLYRGFYFCARILKLWVYLTRFSVMKQAHS